MEDMSVTPDKSGTSVALYTILLAPRNMPLISDHAMLPHFSTDASFAASVALDAMCVILARSPDIETVYVPALAYVCDVELVAVLVVPSPQFTV